MIIFSICFFLFALVVIILFSRYFLYMNLRWKTEGKLRQLGVKSSELNFSFEEITYFISLPNRMPELANASREDLLASPDYTSWIFPTVRGLKFHVDSKKDILLGYISTEHFRLPYFDRLLHEGKINHRLYKEMNAYILLHPIIISKFLDEIHRQLNRSDLNIEEMTN